MAQRGKLMDNVQSKQESKDRLGIDQLLAHLQHAGNQKERLAEQEVHAIFRQIINELPYSYTALPVGLAEALCLDAPLKRTNLELNQVVVALGKALLDPSLNQEITQYSQTYLIHRRITEKEYAGSIIAQALATTDLKMFSENCHDLLKKLTQSILEKIINEKQSRKIIGYTPHSLIEIIDPIIHNKLINPELERIKEDDPVKFRKFVTTVAQDGYEKVKDEKKLTLIQKEKDNAFSDYKNAISAKMPKANQLESLYKKHSFSQRDKNQKHEQLMQQLATFLKASNPKSNMGFLSLHMRMRFSENLRKKLMLADRDISIYVFEDTIKKNHEKVLTEISDHANAIKAVILHIQAIEDHYTKNILHKFIGGKNLALLEEALLDTLLGKLTSKYNWMTGETRIVREDGYTQKSISNIYIEILARLTNIANGLNGLFSNELKSEIAGAIRLIQSASKNIVSSAGESTIIAEPVSAPDMAATSNIKTQASTDFPLSTLAKEKISVIDTNSITNTTQTAIDAQPSIDNKIEAKIVAKPLDLDNSSKPASFASTETNHTIKPVMLEKTQHDQPLPDTKELLTDKPAITENSTEKSDKIIAKPLVIEDSSDETESPVQAKPLLIADFDEEQTTTAEHKPLEVEERASTAVAAPTPTVETTITPKPLLDISFDDDIPTAFEQQPDSVNNEPVILATEETAKANINLPTSFSPEIQEVIDGGSSIMQNYVLGDLEATVFTAWKKIVTGTTAHPDEMHAGDFGSDKEVRLYVICDLVQQIVSISESNLSAENKHKLQALRSQLLQALDDPLDAANWDYFEGIKRDQIDITIAELKG
jgi:hypothetical protein